MLKKKLYKQENSIKNPHNKINKITQRFLSFSN